MTSSQSKLIDLSLTSFSDRLAERTATPGGGSVAAHIASMGAALTAMAFRFTSGPKYAAVEAAMADRVEELERLRGRAGELVDRDTAAYDAVSAAMKLPKDTDAQKAARDQAVQSALRVALEVPFETLETALAALRLCAGGAPDLNPNLASDCATGALCLASACESALMNVKINASSIKDKAYAQARVAGAEELRREADRSLETVRAAARQKLG
jgi:glutamate formiminotransferase/formiminotetrahydrofolate cyclodeaminase